MLEVVDDSATHQHLHNCFLVRRGISSTCIVCYDFSFIHLWPVVFIFLANCFAFSSPCDRPRVIESLRGTEVIDIAAGGAHSACITAAGELYTWGKGRYGRLGHGDSEDQLKPKMVSLQRHHIFVFCLVF